MPRAYLRICVLKFHFMAFDGKSLESKSLSCKIHLQLVARLQRARIQRLSLRIHLRGARSHLYQYGQTVRYFRGIVRQDTRDSGDQRDRNAMPGPRHGRSIERKASFLATPIAFSASSFQRCFLARTTRFYQLLLTSTDDRGLDAATCLLDFVY